MEYVLLSLIVLFVGGLVGFVVLVARELYLDRKHKAIQSDLFIFKKEISDSISLLRMELEPIQAFIMKAHTDLDTIVKEYEINGVPLGYERGKKADFVEGL